MSGFATTAPGRTSGLRAVFERDFLVFTSRPRFLLLRTLTVVLPAALLVTIVISMSALSGVMGSSMLGPVVFGTSATLLPALVMFLAPILSASCICSERTLQTLPIVLAAPVSPLAFVAAKFLSRLGVVLVLELATLPLAGVCFLYGGVSGSLFVEFVAFLVGVAVFGTAVGVVASTWSRTVAAAARLAYFLALAVPLAHYSLVTSFLIRPSPFRGAPARDAYGLAANPVFVWRAIGSMRSGSTGTPGWTFLAWMCGVAALAVSISAWRLRRESAYEVAAAGGSRRASPMTYDNPVLDRALRGTLIRRPRFKSWLGVVLVLVIDGIVMASGYARGSLEKSDPHEMFLCCVTFVVALSALSSAAHSIASERETGALDMLLATRLSPRDVVHGKLVASLLSVTPLLAIGLVHGIIAAVLTKLSPVAVLAWLVGAAAVTFFFAAVAVWCSSSASTAGRAVLAAYAWLLGGSIVHGVVLAIVGVVSRVPGLRSLIWYVMGPSPFYVGIAGVVLPGMSRMRSEEVNLLAAWILWTAAYFAAAPVLVGWATHRLKRRNDVG